MTRLLPALLVMCLCGCAPQSGLRGVVAPDVPVELVKEGFVLAEGPLPMADGGLLFTDVRASRIYKLDVAGSITVFREETNNTNGLAYTPKGELVAAETAGKRLSISTSDGRVSELTNGDGVRPLAAVNDLIVDAKGGVYFTDPDVRPLVPGRKAHVYYLPPRSRVARIVDASLVRPDGLTLTLDGTTLLVDDTVGHIVFAFDVMRDGSLANKRAFARLRNIKDGEDSGADGMAIDHEGRIYVTSVTGVQMFDRAGEYLGTIPVPRKATNVAFSGPGKTTLYITTREALYRVRTLTRGPERPGK